MRSGLFYKKITENWGKPGPVLTARAATWVMNPTRLRDHPEIERAFAEDAAWANAEYGAEWRTDLEAFVGLDAVKACIKPGVKERLAERRNRYLAFVDAAGGSGGDSFTIAISHKEADTAVLDVTREIKPPFSPEGVVAEFADLCRKYRVARVEGDRFAGEFPRELFRRHGIHFAVADRSKSEFYVDLLPFINSGAVDLLDDDRLMSQLVGLERMPRRGSKDSVDHPRGGHNDLANAVAGALVTVMSWASTRPESFGRIPEFEGVNTYDPRIWR